MHTFLSRANAVFAFALSVLAGLTFLCFLTTAFNENQTKFVISSSRHMVKNAPDHTASRERNDLGHVSFDLDVDFSPLFNWNTKQLFVYLTAEYITKNNVLNQVVLWDKIILRHERPVIDLKSANAKYYFWDDGDNLKGHENITLTLSWNVVPNAGRLTLVQGRGSHTFKFPAEYVTGRFS